MPLSGSSASARRHSASSTGLMPGYWSIPNTRANTRLTLPSKIAARVPLENAEIAAAVERPMPGSSASSAGSDGNTPPYSATTRLAQACRLRARV